jgi:RNA polymerase sigma factor (sigma-70 family)
MSPRISIRLLIGQSDDRLLALAREGHERAFEALVHRYRRPLLRYCRRMGLADARAEDVLQHSFLQAWLALTRGPEVRELKPWLYRIVHNASVNAARASSEKQEQLTDAMPARVAVASGSDLEQRIAVRQTLSDVADLPQMQREAILLSAVAGQSHEQVADVLGVTDGAVRGLLYRARATLRAAAAALTPQPLISWACGGGAPTADRLAEAAAPVGATGMVAVVAKGAAVAVTAAVVVGGAAVVPLERHASHRSSSAASSRHAAGAPTGGVSRPVSLAQSPAAGQHASPGLRASATAPGAHGRARHRGGVRHRSGERGDSSPSTLLSALAPSRHGSDGVDGSLKIEAGNDRGGLRLSPDTKSSGGDGRSSSGAAQPVPAGSGAAGEKGSRSGGAATSGDGSGGSGRSGSGSSGDGGDSAQPLTGRSGSGGDTRPADTEAIPPAAS